MVLGADEYRAGLDGYRGGAREKEEKLAELAQDTFFPRLEKVIGLTKARARGPALTWRSGTRMIRRSGCGELRPGGA